MKIALQVGTAWVLGVVAFAAVGWLALLAFAARSAELFGWVGAAVVVLFVCLGLAVYDASWWVRPFWGLAVGAVGVVGTVFVVRLADDWKPPAALGWLAAGLPYAAVAAVFARNWWVRGAGVLVLVAVPFLAPESTWDAFWQTWARLR